MTPEQYLQMVIAATIGIILQLLFKAIRLQKKARESNQVFTLWKWIIEDALILILNILSPYVAVYIFQEFALDDEGIEGKWVNYIRTMFVFIGFSGSSVLMGFFSVIDKKLSKVIDTKTNLADFGSESKPS